MQVLIVISGFCGFCDFCTSDFRFLFPHRERWTALRMQVLYFNPPSRVETTESLIATWITTNVPHCLISSLLFQSAFLRRERHNVDHDHGTGKPISIHVPAWGTTSFSKLLHTHFTFQSTFPRGERHLHRPARPDRRYFNPRSRVGNDANWATH